jgi:hypothetical protein
VTVLLPRSLSCVVGRKLLAGEFCFGPTRSPSSSPASTAPWATKEKRWRSPVRASACSPTANTAALRSCAGSPKRWHARPRLGGECDRQPGLPSAHECSQVSSAPNPLSEYALTGHAGVLAASSDERGRRGFSSRRSLWRRRESRAGEAGNRSVAAYWIGVRRSKPAAERQISSARGGRPARVFVGIPEFAGGLPKDRGVRRQECRSRRPRSRPRLQGRRPRRLPYRIRPARRRRAIRGPR